MRGAARSAALAAAILLAGLPAGGCGKQPTPVTEDDGSLPVAVRIMAKRQEMKLRGAAKDLAGIQRLLDECLALDPNYAGDAYVSAGAAVSEYIYATNPTGAEKASLYQKKIEYFQKAKAAYQAPGARTNRDAEIPKLLELCDLSIQMTQQELGGD